MRVCVCTVVHHPEDARILHRQIRALLDAGHEITYIAPFRACNVTPWREISPVDVPRATGRRRLAAVRAAHRALEEHAPYADVVLLHDPELLVRLPRSVRRRTVVWDVHEDTAAALAAKGWLPAPLAPLLRPLVRRIEDRAERRHRLLLAEDSYQARFRDAHPVVPNTTAVPDGPPAPPGDRRVVYVGHLSQARGAFDIIAAARLLAPEGVTVELIGAADPAVRPALRDAQREGILRWYGFVPNDRALRIAEGATAGLSLLHDGPNHRHSMPTKVIEYMARGLPVVTTPNPAASALVTDAGSGIVVPYRDPEAVAAAVRRLRDDAEFRTSCGKRGHAVARARYHWPAQAAAFVAALEGWAGRVPAATEH
ncbi:glycosyltransferase family 4 protein [Actinomadura flavalba]|uniref:glycosyltransferase family 4 protein n=1 Tax=Actinomadura flavalba TaxID=1120938 RepID=UPI00047802CE|nr:glycosyltransferase family 4 protein [Actinomadura flavalba]